jgi:hypothetical protein
VHSITAANVYEDCHAFRLSLCIVCRFTLCPHGKATVFLTYFGDSAKHLPVSGVNHKAKIYLVSIYQHHISMSSTLNPIIITMCSATILVLATCALARAMLDLEQFSCNTGGMAIGDTKELRPYR